MRQKGTHMRNDRAPAEYRPSRAAVTIIVALLVIAVGAFGYYCYQLVERQTVRQQSASTAPSATPEPQASASVAPSVKRAASTVTATPEPELIPSEVSTTPERRASVVYQCDGRTRCSQMTSCDEAKFFLTNCPGTQMDGDNDGIPCEQQWCN